VGPVRPAGRLQQARLGLGLALKCMSVSGIVACSHAAVNWESAAVCLPTALAGAEGSGCYVKPSPG